MLIANFEHRLQMKLNPILFIALLFTIWKENIYFIEKEVLQGYTLTFIIKG